MAYSSENFTKISLEKRKQISNNLLTKHRDYVPIIALNSDPKSTPFLNKFKFIGKKEHTFGKFLLEAKSSSYILDSNRALFFFCGDAGKIIRDNELLGDLYNKYRDPDGFLYINYMAENTFG